MENKELIREKFDLVIVGGGPAGLTAAIYASRANLSVLVIEKENEGALVSAHKIDNYPGFDEGISGKDLYIKMKDHATKFGTKFVFASFLDMDTSNEEFKIIKTDKKNFEAQVVIIATGVSKSSSKKFPGEEEYLGRGVSYCATCDGAFFKNHVVALFGNGDEVAEEALFLTRFAKEVLIFTKDNQIECETMLLKVLTSNEKVKIYTEKELLEIKGSSYVEKVAIKDTKSGVIEEYDTSAAFMYLGTKNNMEMFAMFADVDERGNIITDENMKTLVEGIYAAGDIRQKAVRQIGTAVSDGTIAAIEAIKYINKNKKK